MTENKPCPYYKDQLFSKIIAVYSGNNMKHLAKKRAEFIGVNSGGEYICYCSLTL